MKALNVCVLALLLALAGCGKNNETNNATNNGATNNGATNNGATNNGATNNGTDPNNGTTNNGTNPNNGTTANNGVTPNEPYISELTYYEESDSTFGSTKSGISIGILGLQISNLDGNTKSLSQADADAFTAAHLGTATQDAMINGWSCPEPAGGDMGGGGDAGPDAGGVDAGPTEPENTWWFEARIQDNGNTKYVQNITGCYLAGDRAVLDIIEAMDALAADYDIMP